MKKTERIEQAVKKSLKGKALLLTALGGVTAYILLVIFSFPTYTFQLLGRDIMYFPEVVEMSTFYVLDNTGMIGLALTVIYAAMTGITLTNIVQGFKMNRFKGLSGIVMIPGFLVSGCASCGVGLLAFLGFSGILGALPFAGNSVKAAGIILMLGILHRNGDPKTCTINE